eukprot:CAMPEP_0182942136 /NCGR_PEP_ID=MMETSP0105_2-20130417/50117_1 /TAXON_ID=81532 ORGANISM="Acanthoeca-like sp., Strain 10tr" /NCGR_SAMPLE_ID=MMETSP0105_2 /ASSEMBLY_ACC=CAM_ASM_000205 /LENGTH=144 /DNA_ID=CAMNT_0025081829 /DNA_START=77 /DNA_END=507 /DNA_ORIENTATION=-
MLARVTSVAAFPLITRTSSPAHSPARSAGLLFFTLLTTAPPLPPGKNSTPYVPPGAHIITTLAVSMTGLVDGIASVAQITEAVATLGYAVFPTTKWSSPAYLAAITSLEAHVAFAVLCTPSGEGASSSSCDVDVDKLENNFVRT